MKRINDLEILNEISLAGNQQHGFLKNKSMMTAGLLLKSLIAEATVTITSH